MVSIADKLVDAGLPRERLEECRRLAGSTGESLDRVILQKDYLEEARVLEVYASHLGYEFLQSLEGIKVPTEFAVNVYDAIVEAGSRHGLAHAGMHAMDSLRVEKAYRHFGHDISPDENPLEAGLGFAVAWDKGVDFLGREALERARAAGRPRRRLVQLLLEDPEPLAYHEEPLWLDGALAGHVTSAAYGHTLGACVALGYLEHPEGVTRELLEGARVEVEIACERYPARAALRPMYDPTSSRIRS